MFFVLSQLQSFRSLPQKPLSVDLTVEEGQRLKVIYGSLSGFHAIDVDSGTPYDLYLPTHVRICACPPVFKDHFCVFTHLQPHTASKTAILNMKGKKKQSPTDHFIFSTPQFQYFKREQVILTPISATTKLHCRFQHKPLFYISLETKVRFALLD